MKSLSPARREHPGPWIAALGMTLLIHGFWFGMLEYQWAPPIAQHKSAPTLLWVDLREPERYADWRAATAWQAPNLFALPHVYGFSRHRLQDRVSMRPPVDQPSPGDLTLSWSAAQAMAQAAAIDEPTVDALAWRIAETSLPLPDEPAPTTASAPAPLLPSAVVAPRIRAIQTPEPRPIEQLHWPEGAAYWGTTAWTAEVVLRIDEQGVVTEALLDRRTPDSEINARLLNAVYGWRWAVGDQSARVRVSISYAGAPLPVTEDAP